MAVRRIVACSILKTLPYGGQKCLGDPPVPRFARMEPVRADQVRKMASVGSPEALLRCVEVVLDCREALDTNVKPQFAVAAMMARLGAELG